MKYLLAGAMLLALANPVVAQQTSTSPNPSGQANAQQNDNTARNLVASQKIKKDLQKAGFTDVKVVAESFVVQAKSKDGDPVLMTIGPRGMSVFEAANNSSGSNTSGSTTGSATSGMSQPSGSSSSTSPPAQSK